MFVGKNLSPLRHPRAFNFRFPATEESKREDRASQPIKLCFPRKIKNSPKFVDSLGEAAHLAGPGAHGPYTEHLTLRFKSGNCVVTVTWGISHVLNTVTDRCMIKGEKTLPFAKRSPCSRRQGVALAARGVILVAGRWGVRQTLPRRSRALTSRPSSLSGSARAGRQHPRVPWTPRETGDGQVLPLGVWPGHHSAPWKRQLLRCSQRNALQLGFLFHFGVLLFSSLLHLF